MSRPTDPDQVVTTAGRAADPAYKKLMWRCEGCGDVHSVHVAGTPLDGEPTWSWNGSLTAPTLKPSILKDVRRGADKACHSFVTDGVVQFLTDSDHELAGRRVPMKPENADPFAAWRDRDAQEEAPDPG